MKPRTSWRRTSFLFFLLALASLTSGCVYLRLLQFKNQLADFEKHFSTDLSEGFRITCKNPVLLGDDLRWLGAEPESVQRSAEAERWRIRWAKELPLSVKEYGVYDIELQVDLTARRVRSVYIPERYFASVSKDIFLNALRSAGHAKIDRQNRQAVMDTPIDGPNSAPAPVDFGSIEKMLGLPTERLEEPGAVRYRYLFRPQTPSGPGKSIEVIFLFDAKSGNLRRFVGKLPKGTLNFDFFDPSRSKK